MTADRELAVRLARTAGETALALRGSVAARSKGAATDVVTEADERVEEALVAILRAERPDDGLLGEEGAAVSGSGRRWLLDPVDGTLNFARGLPGWCCAVALMREDEPLVAAICDPVGGQVFSAESGGGAAVAAALGEGAAVAATPGKDTAKSAALGEGAAVAATPIHPDRNPPPLADAVIATFVDTRRRDRQIVAGTDALLRRVGALRATGCGSLELAWVANGCLHGWIQADVEPWDWFPGALLVAEAGGAIGASGRWRAAAADERLLEQLLAAADADR